MATRRKKMENPETIPKSDFIELLKYVQDLEHRLANLELKVDILEANIPDWDDYEVFESPEDEKLSDNEVFSKIPN